VDWTTLFEWTGYLLLVAVLVTGWLLNILGLPGLWLMVLGHVLFGWATGWNRYVGLPSVLWLIGLALVAEVVEFFAGAAGSAKAGGTKRGMIGAIVGGFVGGIVGQIAIPIPVVGAIVGVLVGSFLGAALIERLIEPDTDRAMAIGFGAAKGRLYGILIKSGFGVVIGLVSIFTALPVNPVTPPPAAPFTTAPASPPLTTLPTTGPMP
jgi:uncharacterized protein